MVERLAIDRAKQLFGAEHANVQPHSGSQANAAAYSGAAPAGRYDARHEPRPRRSPHPRLAKVNFSGKLYNVVAYGVRPDTDDIDYDAVERLAHEHQPKLIVAGFSAYSRVLDCARFRQIAESVGAYLIVDIAHVAGLVAAGLYPNPMPHCRRRHHDDAQDAARPAWRTDPCTANDEITKKLDSLVSSPARRAAR